MHVHQEPSSPAWNWWTVVFVLIKAHSHKLKNTLNFKKVLKFSKFFIGIALIIKTEIFTAPQRSDMIVNVFIDFQAYIRPTSFHDTFKLRL